MADLTQWIEMFRTGKHPGTGALADHTFTSADLDQIVANFSADNPIPHAITHKRLYSPFAFAQGVAMKREGDSIWVKSDQVNPDFQKLVDSGALYERSVELDFDEVKGWFMIRITWLGAEPPAVEGLAPVQMSGTSDQVTRFSLDWSDVRQAWTVAKLFQRIRDWLIAQHGVKQADEIIDDWDVQDLQRIALDREYEFDQQEAKVGLFTKSGGSMTDEEKAALVAQAKAEGREAAEAEFAKKEAQFQKDQAALQQQLAEQAQAQKKAIFSKKLEGLLKEGKLTPAQAEGIAEFALALPDEQPMAQFSRGGSVVQESPFAWFSHYLEGLPKQVPMATGSGDGPPPADQITDPEMMAQKAQALMAKRRGEGVEIGLLAAMAEVSGGDA
jgi:hypothetical protein